MDSVRATQLHRMLVLESQRSSSSEAHSLIVVVIEVALDQLGKGDRWMDGWMSGAQWRKKKKKKGNIETEVLVENCTEKLSEFNKSVKKRRKWLQTYLQSRKRK